MLKKTLNQNTYLIAALLLLAITFVANWTWYIYDMDDGSTIAYHMLGRNEAIQPPYNYYDAFCDYALSYLPRDYYTFYAVTVVGTLLATMCTYVMLSKMAVSFAGVTQRRAYAIGLLFLLAMPDLFYLTFSFKCSLLAFPLILGSHYILAKNVQQHSYLKMLLAALLFGLGAASRWNLTTYGLAIFVDIALLYNAAKMNKRIIVLIGWGIASLAFFLLFVNISGYSLNKFLETAVWGHEYMTALDYQMTAILVICAGMFTPVMVLLLFTSLVLSIKHYKTYRRPIAFLITSMLPFFYLRFNPNLKYMITLLPATFVFFTIGANYLYNRWLSANKVLYTGFVVLTLLPWFIGVRVYSDGTMWGPGYELKQKLATNATHNKALDERTGKRSYTVGLYDGFAITTAEGTKPLWGNFYVLYTGKLRNMTSQMGKEAEDVLAYAKAERMDVFTDRGNPVLLAGICKQHYLTQDSAKQGGPVTIRTFYNGSDTIVVKRFNVKSNITEYTEVKKLLTKRFAAHFTYTSLMTDFAHNAPKHGIKLLKQTGPFSGVFEIQD